MAFAAWAEEIPSKIYQIPPGALAGRPQISPELAGPTTITHRSSSVRGLHCGAIFEYVTENLFLDKAPISP